VLLLGLTKLKHVTNTANNSSSNNYINDGVIDLVDKKYKTEM